MPFLYQSVWNTLYMHICMYVMWSRTYTRMLSILSKVGHVGAYVSEINRNQVVHITYIHTHACRVEYMYSPCSAPLSSKIEAYHGFRMHD